jgi:hypothetical protein
MGLLHAGRNENGSVETAVDFVATSATSAPTENGTVASIVQDSDAFFLLKLLILSFAGEQVPPPLDMAYVIGILL